MALAFERLDTARHDRAVFSCGEKSLDDFLKKHAAQNQPALMSVTHVLVDPDAGEQPFPIIGYFTLSSAQVEFEDLPPEITRRLPKYPLPAMMMGRPAIDQAHQGKKLGELLVAEAVRRCLSIGEDAGVRLLLVDALNDGVVGFYEKFGFRRTARHARRLYLTL